MFPFFQGFSLISMIFISTYIRSGCKKFLSAPGLQGETFLSAPLKFLKFLSALAELFGISQKKNPKKISICGSGTVGFRGLGV